MTIQVIKYGGSDFDEFLKDLLEISKGNLVESVLTYIINNTKITQYYDNKKMYQANANISKLKDMSLSSSGSSIMNSIAFLDMISSKINSLAEEDEAPISDENRKKGVVSAYTVHKAKGLSFPVVIIANMDEGLINKRSFPKVIAKKIKNNTCLAFKEDMFENSIVDNEYEKLKHISIFETLEEELRVLYVVCTRAKHMLVLSCQRPKYKILAPENKALSWAKWGLQVNDGNIS